jgi:endoglycosylceramidase
MDDADKYLQSWLGWDYKPYVAKTGSGSSIWYDNGTMNMQVVDRLSRTYAQSVAGVTTLMHYDENTQEFTLHYHTTSACTSYITVIYLNKAVHYASGYTVSILPSHAASWRAVDTNSIHVTHNVTLPDGTGIQVIISPSNEL